jgi:aminopeptidase-like protein/aminoglycoside N3'-acetyltransferase
VDGRFAASGGYSLLAQPAAEPAPYSEADLLAALHASGVTRGDTLFVQASLDRLGRAADCASVADRSAMVLRALRDAVGPGGTLIVPTYTFSFCRQQPFDIARSETAGGPWSESAEFLEYVRGQAGSIRSRDPIHSVVALGPGANEFLHNLPTTCFGNDSVQHRLRRAGGKICMLGLDVHEATMVHHAEAMSAVPFRYKKLFTGEINDQGRTSRQGWIYDVRVPMPHTELEASRINEGVRARGLLRTTALGAGVVHVIEARLLYDFLCEALAVNPWFTARGPAADPLRLDQQRVPAPSIEVTLPPDASLETIVRTLWPVPRDIVSDGYDAALAALATQVPMRVHEYPTGTECFTWIVPEKWTCHEAWLETLDGRRLFSYADHPLHVMSYSQPFDGIVSREELFRHLHVHERLPEAIPFIFKYYERDWGLCCSRRFRDTLLDARYRVVIRSSFSYGTLKVGEVVVPGRTDESVVLCAHLCHPGMAVDDLTGVAVGIGVVRELLRRDALRYTYRLLILPETIGSLAYLSAHQSLTPRLKGGLFLEMLGLDNPHALQYSLAANTEVDECFAATLEAGDPRGWTTPYRSMPGNDERQFNAPGIRVPMLSLLRCLPPSAPGHPYLEYHSSHDTPAIVNWTRLSESQQLVLEMIDTLEQNRVPINRFSGEVCCSRHGLHIDPVAHPEAHRSLFRTMDLIDGTRSLVRIANQCGVHVDAVRTIVDELERRGLVEYADLAGREPARPSMNGGIV